MSIDNYFVITDSGIYSPNLSHDAILAQYVRLPFALCRLPSLSVFILCFRVHPRAIQKGPGDPFSRLPGLVSILRCHILLAFHLPLN